MNKKIIYFPYFVLCLVLFVSCKKDHTNKVPVADAGNGISITPPEDAITLKGTGTDADGQITSYLWSEVSGPNTPTIATPSSASTNVSGFNTGTYVFQLMVVDNQGATGVDTVSVLVNPSPIDSVTLTDGDAGYFDLTFAGNATLDYTDPQSPGLDAAAWNWNGLPDILRGSLKFDLSKLPQNITIQSAKLNLYSDFTPNNGNLVDANYGADNSIFIQRVTSNWSMGSGWFSQPTSSTQDMVVIPHTNLPQLDLIGIDVTPMVTAMYTGPNYGFLFRLVYENENTSRLFCGVRHADASKHPRLKVVFKYN